MWSTEALAKKISSGQVTSLRLNGKNCTLAAAENLKSSPRCCTGNVGALQFRIGFKRQSGRFIFDLTLRNTGKKPLTVGDITLFTHSEKKKEGKLPRNVFAFNDSLLSENFVEAATDQKGKHTSRPLALIYEVPAGRSFFSAQWSFDKNNVLYAMQFDTKGKLQELRCTVPVIDYVLAPGLSVTTDQVAISLDSAPTPREALNEWASAVNHRYRPRIPAVAPAGFLCGWLISTKAEKTDSQIRRTIAAAGQLKKLGASYIWASIDNLPNGMPGNWLASNRSNFRDGVPAFLEEITAAGFKPGLWIAPFLITERSRDFAKVKDFLLKEKNGEPQSRFRWYWGTLDEEGKLPKAYALDYDRIEAARYIGHVLETYAEWGVRYYMCDFISSGRHDDQNPSVSFCQENYRKFLRGLSRHVTPDTFILSAVGSSLTNIGAFQSARIGMDYGEARQLEPNFESYPANYIINGSFGSSGSPNKNAIQNLAMWGFAHGKFFLCNSNVMTVDKPIPLNEAIISASLFGLSPSPVFFQDDVERMSPERLSLLKKVLPRCPGMPEAADLFSKTDSRSDFLRIFRLHIRKPWGEWTLCGIFNLNDNFRTVELSADLLNLDPAKEYWMYDFWDECYMGTFSGRRTVEVPKMSCKIYRFAEKTAHPWILSTDFHVRQGEAELSNVRWDEKHMTLSGTARRVAGESGTIFVVSPDTWKERHDNRGMLVAKSALDDALVIKLPIRFAEDTMKWKIEFAPCHHVVAKKSEVD